MTGLSIARHLQGVLSADPGIKAKVADRIFPISTVTSTRFPFIVYERDGISPEYTKDGLSNDSVTCTVYVFTETYIEGVDIAELVRAALESGHGEYDGTKIYGADMTGAAEGFTDNTFVQQMQFSFDI